MTAELEPAELGIRRGRPEELVGGGADVNAAVATDLLDGRTGPVRDVVLLNAAATLVAWEGHVGPDSLNEAFATQLERAAEAVDSGAAKAKLTDWVAVTRSFR